LALFWIVLIRAGLLSLILMLSEQDMLQAIRVSVDYAHWHALPMLINNGALFAVALWGFRAAVAGRPLFRDEIQEPRTARSELDRSA